MSISFNRFRLIIDWFKTQLVKVVSKAVHRSIWCNKSIKIIEKAVLLIDFEIYRNLIDSNNFFDDYRSIYFTKLIDLMQRIIIGLAFLPSNVDHWWTICVITLVSDIWLNCVRHHLQRVTFGSIPTSWKVLETIL